MNWRKQISFVWNFWNPGRLTNTSNFFFSLCHFFLSHRNCQVGLYICLLIPGFSCWLGLLLSSGQFVTSRDKSDEFLMSFNNSKGEKLPGNASKVGIELQTLDPYQHLPCFFTFINLSCYSPVVQSRRYLIHLNFLQLNVK